MLRNHKLRAVVCKLAPKPYLDPYRGLYIGKYPRQEKKISADVIWRKNMKREEKQRNCNRKKEERGKKKKERERKQENRK